MNIDKLLVVGDSHSTFFNYSSRIRFHLSAELADFRYWVLVKHGSTIRGFGKRNSTLQLHDEIMEHINEHEPTHLVMALGQVDIELGMYYRKLIKQENVDNFIKETVDIYSEYIEKLERNTDCKIILKGVNPTVLLHKKFASRYVSRIITENISDEKKIRHYRNVLEQDFPSFQYRHKLHYMLNKELKGICKDKNLTYFDLWDDLIDSKTGVIADKFIPCGFDHHVADTIEVRSIYQRALFNLMNESF